MERRHPRHIESADDFAAAFPVSHETVARLKTYAELLQHWQRVVNLVGPDTMPDLWHRHFADCAQLRDLAPGARTWLDLGAGAGFPGLVIAVLLANQNGAMVHLVESNARKCAFLHEVARATGAPVTIHHARIETLEFGRDIPIPEVVTARALAPLERLLELAHPFWAPTTQALFPKGRRVESELTAARRRWRFDVQLHASRTDPHGRIVGLRTVAPIEGGP